jgi:hypothetical protein
MAIPSKGSITFNALVRSLYHRQEEMPARTLLKIEGRIPEKDIA